MFTLSNESGNVHPFEVSASEWSSDSAVELDKTFCFLDCQLIIKTKYYTKQQWETDRAVSTQESQSRSQYADSKNPKNIKKKKA